MPLRRLSRDQKLRTETGRSLGTGIISRDCEFSEAFRLGRRFSSSDAEKFRPRTALSHAN
jgi:hypothetical protein